MLKDIRKDIRIELLNWSGHHNLGDDAMAQILMETIPGAVNMGETSSEADWYIFGGGTLISPGSLYFNLIKHPERTIGFSLGVSYNWNGEWLDKLKQLKKIYVRDEFSQKRLAEFGVESTLSVDLLCYLEPQPEKPRVEVWVNAFRDSYPQGDKYFALSPVEDKEVMPQAEVYDDFRKLAADLMGAKCVVASRLHANVLAWMTKCPKIYLFSPPSHGVDFKVVHFYERVAKLTPEEARSIISNHLRELKELTQVYGR